MSRFEEITGQELKQVNKRTTTDEEAAKALGITVIDYRELCHIYSQTSRDEHQKLAENSLIGTSAKPKKETIVKAMKAHESLNKAAKSISMAPGRFIYWATKYGLHTPTPHEENTS